MVDMVSQMMHHTHDYEWNPRATNKRTKRQKNIKGMEKWNEKTYGGGWEMSRHLEGDFLPRLVCWPPLESFPITQDKSSNLRGHKPH